MRIKTLHKIECKDRYGNPVPCHYSSRALWSEPGGQPDPSDDGTSNGDVPTQGMYIPTFENMIGTISLVTKLSRGAFLGYIRLLIRMGEDVFWLMVQSINFTAMAHTMFNLPEGYEIKVTENGSLDFSGILERIISEEIGFRVDLPEVSALVVEIPGLDHLIELLSVGNIQAIQGTAWSAFGFNPMQTVLSSDWLDNAASYVMREGIMGSAFIDDVLALIRPEFAYIKIVFNLLEGCMEWGLSLNEIYTQYNAVRLNLISFFQSIMETEQSIDAIVEVMNQYGLPTEDVQYYLSLLGSELESIIDKINLLMPEFPELDAELLRIFSTMEEQIDFSWFDPSTWTGTPMLELWTDLMMWIEEHAAETAVEIPDRLANLQKILAIEQELSPTALLELPSPGDIASTPEESPPDEFVPSPPTTDWDTRRPPPESGDPDW